MAFVERFIQTLGQECLDHFIVFGQRHLNHLCSEFVDYYHRLRPQQSKENSVLVRTRRRKSEGKKQRSRAPKVIPLSEIRCERRLGGLLKHYYRKAA